MPSSPTDDAWPRDEVQLVRPAWEHRGLFLEAVEASRDLHRHWCAPPNCIEAFRWYVDGAQTPDARAYLVLHRRSQGLVGAIHLSEIMRGNLQTAFLGYYAFAGWTGRGLMTAALSGVIDEAWNVLGLHRLEANIQPDNEPSRRLVQRLGFRLEGFSPRYLKIDGQWRDHERWALLVDDQRAGVRRENPLAK